MIKVCDLPRGWVLWADPECHEVQVMPVFRDRHGRKMGPARMAYEPDAPVVFREVKRMLDVADVTWALPGQDIRFRGLDVGKIALQLALQNAGKWDRSLLQTGVF